MATCEFCKKLRPRALRGAKALVMKNTSLFTLLVVAALQCGCVSHYVAKQAVHKARDARAEAKVAKADARAARAEANESAVLAEKSN